MGKTYQTRVPKYAEVTIAEFENMVAAYKAKHRKRSNFEALCDAIKKGLK